MLYSLLLRDSLAIRLDVPESVRAGEPVRVAARLTNKTERALTCALRRRSTVTLVVARADGAAVCRLFPEPTSDSPAERVLEPAESLILQAWWDGRVAGGTAAPGRYLVTGRLSIEGEEPVDIPPAQFELLPYGSGST